VGRGRRGILRAYTHVESPYARLRAPTRTRESRTKTNSHPGHSSSRSSLCFDRTNRFLSLLFSLSLKSPRTRWTSEIRARRNRFVSSKQTARRILNSSVLPWGQSWKVRSHLECIFFKHHAPPFASVRPGGTTARERQQANNNDRNAHYKSVAPA